MFGNRMLDELDDGELGGIEPYLERITVERSDVMYERGEIIDHVWFPITCVASIDVVVDHERFAELAEVGNEGIVGLPVFFGSLTTPGRGRVEIAGEVVRLGTPELVAALATDGLLHEPLRSYTQAFFVQIAQDAVCARVHPMDRRIARWLLTTRERVRRDEVPLVDASAMAPVLRVFAQSGLVEMLPDAVRIVDALGLERATCECYAITRAALIRPTPVRSSLRHEPSANA